LNCSALSTAAAVLVVASPRSMIISRTKPGKILDDR
jgi:hypothetical protein